jgi:hypothetical protein
MPKPRPKDLLAFATEIASTIPVFRTADRASNDSRFEWIGESPQEFVNIATKAGARLLYVRTFAEGSGHEDEPAIAELAFQCDGLFHYFRTVAPWANESVLVDDDGLEDTSGENEEDNDESEVESLLNGEANDAELAANLSADEDVIVDAFTEHLMNRREPISTDATFVNMALEEYLAETRGTPENSWDLPKYTRVVARISKRVGKEIGEREANIIDDLVKECVSWARSNGVKTLNQNDAAVFLQETKRQLSYESARMLWQKAKFELKARR